MTRLVETVEPVKLLDDEAVADIVKHFKIPDGAETFFKYYKGADDGDGRRSGGQ